MGNNQSSPLRQKFLKKRKDHIRQSADLSDHLGFSKRTRIENKHFDIIDGFPFGSVVLARLKDGDSFWPAVVVFGCDVGQQPAKQNHYWVFWLGCQQISQVKSSLVMAFDSDKVPQKMGKLLARGLIEAKEEVKLQQCMGAPQLEVLIADASQYLPLSVSLWSKIKEFKEKNAAVTISSLREKQRFQLPANSCTLKARNGSLKLPDFCISCDDPTKVAIRGHPIFVGGICQLCLSSIKETIFDCGIDGAGSYCAICAKPGDLLVCDHPDCLLRTFCTLCINRMDAPNAVENALSLDTWVCYVCRDRKTTENMEGCLVRVRLDWRTQLMLLFGASETCLMPPSNLKAVRRPITVLSVFDGISTDITFGLYEEMKNSSICFGCYCSSQDLFLRKDSSG